MAILAIVFGGTPGSNAPAKGLAIVVEGQSA